MPQQSIGTTAERILLPNSKRKSVLFVHIGTANNIFLDPSDPDGLTTANASIRLSSGGALSLNLTEDGFVQIRNAWSAISDSGDNNLAIFETYDA